MFFDKDAKDFKWRDCGITAKLVLRICCMEHVLCRFRLHTRVCGAPIVISLFSLLGGGGCVKEREGERRESAKDKL